MSFKVEVEDSVAFIQINTPDSEVNSVDEETLDQLSSLEEQLNVVVTNVEYVILVSTKLDSFMTAVDFRLLSKSCWSNEAFSRLVRSTQRLTNFLENFPKPVIALIAGQCNSFGLELALACKYRVALNTDFTTFGIPDVQWGMCPYAGGCRRLVHVVKPQTAMDLLLNSVTLSAEEAFKEGLVDHLVQPRDIFEKTWENLKKEGVDIARSLTESTTGRKMNTTGFYDKMINFISFKWDIWCRIEDEVMDKGQNLYPAPLGALALARLGLRVSNAEERQAYDMAERVSIKELVMTNQARALLSLQLDVVDRKLSRVDYTRFVAIVGHPRTAANIFSPASTVKKDLGYYPDAWMNDGNSYELCFSDEYLEGSLAAVVVVVEDVSDDPCIKAKWRQMLDSDRYVLAVVTTQSRPFSYSVDNDKVVCLRTFNYVHKVVEVVVNCAVSSHIISIVNDFSVRQGNVVVLSQNTPGSFVLRVLMAMIGEILALIVEGVDPWKLEQWMKKFGYVGGSLSLVDRVGVDVVYRELSYLGQVFGQRFDCPNGMLLLKDMITHGYLGHKTGIGFYDASTNDVNVLLKPLLKQYVVLKDGAGVKKGNAEWRVTCRLANEALMCLEEQVVQSSVDGDIAAVYALGFPPALGGPFRWVDLQGASKIIQRMKEFNINPCQMLIKLTDNKDDKICHNFKGRFQEFQSF